MGGNSLGDDIEDHYWGTQGIETGGLANQVGLEQYRQTQSNASRPAHVGKVTSGAKSTSLEEMIAGLIGLALGAVIVFYGIGELGLAWYWPVGGGLIAGHLVYRLLMGPLFILVRMVVWALTAAVLVGLGMLIFGK